MDWADLAEAAYYRYRVDQCTSDTYDIIYTTGDLDITPSQVLLTLPSSGPNDHYEFTLDAYNGSGLLVGRLMMEYVSGYGWDYRFRTAAPGVATKIQVETRADGNGAVVPAQNLNTGASMTVYAVARDGFNNFVGNIAADSWSLTNKTGGIVDADLVPSGDMKNATLTGHLEGTGQIHPVKSGVISVDSGTVTVVKAPLSLVVHVVSDNSFDVIVDGVTIDTIPDYTTRTYPLNQLPGSHSVILRPKGIEDTTVTVEMSLLNGTDYYFVNAEIGAGIWNSLTFMDTWGAGAFLFDRGLIPSHEGDFSFTYDFAYKTADTYEFMTKWGTGGTGDGQFGFPAMAAVDSSGNIYVTDNYNHRVQKFASDGTFLTKWGSQGAGNGQFDAPVGIAIDGTGNVYVADMENHTIQKFTSDGAYLTQWGSQGTGNGQFNFPFGVAVDSAGNIYAVDGGNNRIQKFTSDGTYLTQWGSLGTGDGQFDRPFGIAVSGFGHVYVADYSNNRVQEFTSGGVYITKWGLPGTGEGQFNYPVGVTVDSFGSVYVSDTQNGRIQKFTPNGTFWTTWGSLGSGDGQFNRPGGLVVDGNGYVYVPDCDNNRVQKFQKR